jgi:hypothetical protein
MGLRLVKGLDLSKSQNFKAYNYYKADLHDIKVINNHLIANNINLLDDILVDII